MRIDATDRIGIVSCLTRTKRCDATKVNDERGPQQLYRDAPRSHHEDPPSSNHVASSIIQTDSTQNLDENLLAEPNPSISTVASLSNMVERRRPCVRSTEEATIGDAAICHDPRIVWTSNGTVVYTDAGRRHMNALNQ